MTDKDKYNDLPDAKSEKKTNKEDYVSKNITDWNKFVFDELNSLEIVHNLDDAEQVEDFYASVDVYQEDVHHFIFILNHAYRVGDLNMFDIVMGTHNLLNKVKQIASSKGYGINEVDHSHITEIIETTEELYSESLCE